MAFYAPANYRSATKVQNLLIDKMQDSEESGIALAQLARAWIEAEHLKREMRGLPRLAPASVKELLESRKTKQLASSNVTITELDEPTTNHPQTVPAPPEGEAPIAPVVGNDK